MIVILTQCFPSRTGGIESLVSNLALGLSKKQKVLVFADRHHVFFDAMYDNTIKKNFIVRRIGGIKYFRRRKKIKELRPFIMSGKIACVIGESWKSLELCIDLLNNKKIPTICLAHGNELIKKNTRKILKITNVLNKCNLIITNSAYTSNLVKDFGIYKSPIEKIYPGVENFDKIKEKKINFIKGNPIILTLARLEKRKGHIYVLNALKQLKDEFKNLQYIIAGDGPELNNLKKEVLKNKLGDNVIFLGKISDQEKKYIFSRTDLMVMPTIDESEKGSIEGFGISYIEAALYGIPSIASNIGGTPEAVLHNKTGIIINKIEKLEDAIMDLLKNKEKILYLGNQAKKRAMEEFQWENKINEYLSLIYNLNKN